MRRLLNPLFVLVLCACGPPPAAPAPARAPETSNAPRVANPGPVAPVAPRIRHVEKLHGVERVDEYAWLRKKDSPEVLAYLRAENAYTDAVMKGSEPLQARLYDEMLSRIREDDTTFPYKLGGFLYYTRTEKGKQYPIHCRRKGEGAPEQVLLELNEIAKDHKYVGVGPMAVSDDGNLLAYGLDTTGFRQFVLHVKDLRTNKLLDERIERVTAVAFSRDGKTLVYAVEDPVSKRSHKVFRHVIGSDPKGDPLVYEEADALFDVFAWRTRSRELIVIHAQSKMTTEVRILPAARPASAPRLIAQRRHGHEYFVDHAGDDLVIRTNLSAAGEAGAARNFRLVKAKLADPAVASWKEIVPHREDVMLTRADVFKGFIALNEREDGLPRVRILDPQGKTSHRVDFPEPIYVVGPDSNPEFDQAAYRVSYSSPITPRSVYDYDVKAKKLVLRKRLDVPNYDPTRYEVRRIHATARDGTRVPLSLTYRKGASPDGKHAMLLQGYGSYGHALPNAFSPNVISLIDRGAVLALAHVRGGGELGKRWHEQGRMMHKMNTFTDFIAAAEQVVAAGWAARDRLAIQGGSAGGLLMGAVTNMRPDLFKAVVAEVPFVDVINTMLDESLPLTVSEFEEWGNPKIKEHYDYMVKYSPYDNIEAKGYPALLVRTSYNDSQVMYWEPAKYVAKLRATKTDKNPLLLKINLDPAGHGGQSGRYDRLRETAFTFAWVLRQLELDGDPTGRP
jgi:oligopeptidase B